ncbi:uracil-DNA glycosylase [Mesorhizobium sp. M0772]|uniref:uracil-DNA glycosylase n=1 Tax=Mesorhizobium sp. M0772 TaxID=2956998 RepID=UPI00333A1889
MTAAALDAAPEPDRDCPLCPRLHDFIADWRQREPSWFNAPVPTFLPPDGEDAVELLIVGLAPGLRGANRTGRPFTGDYAGDLLYSTMIAHGLARGEFKARPDDGLELIGTAITNAVRCVPPENKPVGAEISSCRSFLVPTIARFPGLRAVLALGSIAHQSTVRALGQRAAAYPFKHGGRLPAGGVTLFSSYHCSRYNTNTGVLTEKMFVKVFSDIAEFLRN